MSVIISLLCFLGICIAAVAKMPFNLFTVAKVASVYKLVTKNINKVIFSSAAARKTRFRLASASVALGTGYTGFYYVTPSRELKNSSVKIVNKNILSDLDLILFQYRTCPFCCKVRSFLDYFGVEYSVVEVDPLFKQSIKWSQYKKVPIVLARTEGAYVQVNDSSLIISALKSLMISDSENVADILKYYPTLDGETSNRYSVMNYYENNDERKWRMWCDNNLIHTISPNIYRSYGESLQSLKWFSKEGLWENHFAKWQVNLMIYSGAAIMWLLAKRLKRKYNLKEDVRQSLYDDCDLWMRILDKGKKLYMGGKEPNLSDLAVYGALSSFEGCEAFGDMRRETKIGQWYDRMKDQVANQRGAAKLLN